MNIRLISVCSIFLLTFVSAKKLKRIDDRMKILESQLQLESMSRLQDVSRLSDILDSMEKQLNTSKNECCSAEIPKDSETQVQQPADSSTDRDVLMEAFKDEKQGQSRLRQRVTEINDMVTNVSRVYSSIRNEIDIEKSAREQTEETFQAKYVTLSEKLDAAIKQMKSIEEKCSSNYDNLLNEIELSVKENLEKLGTEVAVNRKSTMDIIDAIDKLKINVKKYNSCLSIYQSGVTENGVYNIYPTDDDKPVQVYCDMTTDGGGWTVFQRRQDGSVYFYRDWDDYKQGFGDVSGEFWLGNDHIAALTNGSYHELRIELGDFDGGVRYAKYDKFQVLPESDNYKLIVDGYSGDAGDSFKYHNNMKFSTKDRDNDDLSSDSCATSYKGGWWYRTCHDSNLNGLYLQGPNTANSEGVNWKTWLGWRYSLKMTEMKFR